MPSLRDLGSFKSKASRISSQRGSYKVGGASQRASYCRKSEPRIAKPVIAAIVDSGPNACRNCDSQVLKRNENPAKPGLD
jgi:hypothetical protein